MIRRRVGYFCWLLASAALYFFENNTGTRAVLVCSLLLPAFSIACAAWTAKRADCRLRVPEQAGKGETVSCGCSLSGPWTGIGCALSCRVRWRNLLTHETGLWETDGGKEAFAVSCAHCGTLAIRAEEVFARDWLGLIRFSGSASASASLLILPEMYPVRVSLSAGQSAFIQEPLPGQPRPDGAEMENSGVRDYAPGDPIRRIHWKLSAKTDRLLIREADRPTANSILLLLETSGYGNDPSDMDSAAEALLSVSEKLTEEGQDHCVYWMDQGGLQWVEIACREDYLSMRYGLLGARAEETGESIGTLFSRAFPDVRADHAVIFSPRSDVDAMSMLEIGPVTLALPRREEGNPPVRAVRLCREEPEIEL